MVGDRRKREHFIFAFIKGRKLCVTVLCAINEASLLSPVIGSRTRKGCKGLRGKTDWQTDELDGAKKGIAVEGGRSWENGERLTLNSFAHSNLQNYNILVTNV